MRNVLRPTIFATLLLATTACTPSIDVRGNNPLPDQMVQIKVGETTQDEVTTLLGTPSSTMNYGEEVWHYISGRTETTAFFLPEEKERKIVTIFFDAHGKVSNVTTLTLLDGKVIQSVSRETPTAGKDLSFIEQLLGNVGKFSKDEKKQ